MKSLLCALAAIVLVAFSGQASEITSGVMAELNLARSEPQRYAQLLQATMGQSGNAADVEEAVRFLQKQRPLGTLNPSQGLAMGAKLHVDQIGPIGERGHGNPLARINKFGRWIGRAGEAIYYGKRDARGIVCALIVDTGVRDRSHRRALFTPTFALAGVSYGPHAKFGAMCVIDMAQGYVENTAGLASL